MAAATVIGLASTSSSSLFIKLTNFSSDHRQFTSISIPTNRFTSKQNPIKTLNLKPHPLLSSSPFSILSRSILSCASYSYGSTGSISSNEWPTDSEDEDEVNNGEGRLYVGSLPYSITNSALSVIFGQAGRVASVEIIRDRETDQSRGFGFVTMASVHEAKEAIRLFDGSKIEGRKVKVNFPEVPKGGERETMQPKIQSSNRSFIDSPHKLYAGNLSWDITSEQLKDAFGDLSGILSAKVIYDRDSGRSRGFGFVSFATARELESAIDAMNGVELEGRPVRLNIAVERS
ncbi:33 kDa ribonucleoprotein, chloroplastic-like [Impatiens glandulifera]|uniref:33 kDa ribonucleoprotein, chloroplastic-like n=1 Tax=Impatiens glandulifera TaxID=253017 RepID=UPI001FB127A7|nr:33 kDa ribonucleoprotein, chloroplastic-like [Impatiens glandulifera]